MNRKNYTVYTSPQTINRDINADSDILYVLLLIFSKGIIVNKRAIFISLSYSMLKLLTLNQPVTGITITCNNIQVSTVAGKPSCSSCHFYKTSHVAPNCRRSSYCCSEY